MRAGAEVRDSLSRRIGRQRKPRRSGAFWNLLVEEAAHLAAAARVLELSQRLGFDLADTFAGTLNCWPTSSSV